MIFNIKLLLLQNKNSCTTDTAYELLQNFQTIDIISDYNIYNFDILYAFLSLSDKKLQYQNYF